MHANVRDEVFLRVGDENRRLTFAQRQELSFDRGQDGYEARPTAALIGEAEGSLLADYMRATAAPDGNRPLRARGLGDGQHLTVAEDWRALNALVAALPVWLTRDSEGQPLPAQPVHLSLRRASEDADELVL